MSAITKGLTIDFCSLAVTHNNVFFLFIGKVNDHVFRCCLRIDADPERGAVRVHEGSKQRRWGQGEAETRQNDAKHIIIICSHVMCC